MDRPIARRTLLGLAALTLVRPLAALADDRHEAAARRGRAFLAGLLDAGLGLLPEFRGARVYWLSHDNELAARVLESSHPEVAATLHAALRREGLDRSDGKMRLIATGVAPPGLFPLRQYELTTVRAVDGKTIRTEVVTDRPLPGWDRYTDLLLYAALADPDPARARRHWLAALALWDGHGFRDPAGREQGLYATYKLALARIVARRLDAVAELPAGLVDRLLALQAESGGWITDYRADGTPVGLANVETTGLAILALQAPPVPAKPPSGPAPRA